MQTVCSHSKQPRVQFSSVQFNMVFMRSEKPIRSPPHLSEVFSALPLSLKQSQTSFQRASSQNCAGSDRCLTPRAQRTSIQIVVDLSLVLRATGEHCSDKTEMKSRQRCRLLPSFRRDRQDFSKGYQAGCWRWGQIPPFIKCS